MPPLRWQISQVIAEKSLTPLLGSPLTPPALQGSKAAKIANIRRLNRIGFPVFIFAFRLDRMAVSYPREIFRAYISTCKVPHLEPSQTRFQRLVPNLHQIAIIDRCRFCFLIAAFVGSIGRSATGSMQLTDPVRFQNDKRVLDLVFELSIRFRHNFEIIFVFWKELVAVEAAIDLGQIDLVQIRIIYSRLINLGTTNYECMINR